MKKLTFLICLPMVFAFTIFQVQQVNAQDYNITFAGTGYATTFDSVEVENLTTGKTLTLKGSDILHLSPVVGIPQLENNPSTEMRIYPNPTAVRTILALYPPIAGEAVITVYDMTGKTVAKMTAYLENDRQEFRLSGLKSGMYLINATGNTFQCSAKILCSGQVEGNLTIEKVSNTAEPNTAKTLKKGFVETQGTIDMQYNAGERLKFKAISGIYSTVKTYIPTQDKTLTFNFVPCTDGDNNHYPVVEIGGQIWMAENLKTTRNTYGELIATTIPDTLDISVLDGMAYQWAYDGDESYVANYGRLYTFSAACYACPTGWHVPDEDAWMVMTDYLGGQNFAGGKLKEKGIVHWSDPNKDATNQTGFTALPGGRRDSSSFVGMGSKGEWLGADRHWGHDGSFYTGSVRPICFDKSDIQIDFSFNPLFGYSVRCLYDSVKIFPTTADVTEIHTTTAISGGNIIEDWGYPIIARGICWSSKHSPTVLDSLTSDGAGIGTFTSSLTGLQPDLTYNIRAYAINSEGTAYGNLIAFKTFPLWPTVSTTAITNITQTSAISGGSIIYNGASTVTARGICWSTMENPTITNSIITNGTNGESFTSTINGTINTRYFVRAYATNSFGTGYGNEIMFSTKGETSSVSDVDGNTYSTIEIGTQTWMAENLKTTKYNDGTAIPFVTNGDIWAGLTTPGYCWYNNDSATYNATYGVLYNWHTVNNGKLCPSGWHVPTHDEWIALDNYLGGYGLAGGKLKEAGFAHWSEPNEGATNETGFTALPGGCRYVDGTLFYQIKFTGSWWSSSLANDISAWSHQIYNNGSYIDNGNYSQNFGFSARCLKD